MTTRTALMRSIALALFVGACTTGEDVGAAPQDECEFIGTVIQAAGARFSSLRGAKQENVGGSETWHSKLVAPGATYCDVHDDSNRTDHKAEFMGSDFVCYWDYGASLSETELNQRAKAFAQQLRSCVEKSPFASHAWVETASMENNLNNPPLYVLDKDHALVIEIVTRGDKASGGVDYSDVLLSVQWFMPAKDWPHELEYMKKVNLPMIPLVKKG